VEDEGGTRKWRERRWKIEEEGESGEEFPRVGCRCLKCRVLESGFSSGYRGREGREEGVGRMIGPSEV
jgi:hypothetical protein